MGEGGGGGERGGRGLELGGTERGVKRGMLLTKCTVLQNSFVKNSRNVCFERDHLKAWVAPSRPLSITIINQVPQLHGIFTSRHSLSQTIRAYTRTVFSSSSHTKCCVTLKYVLYLPPMTPSCGTSCFVLHKILIQHYRLLSCIVSYLLALATAKSPHL